MSAAQRSTASGCEGDARVIIIGAGPAGVSAAWPLVRAGVPVMMLDAAEGDPPASPTAPSLAAFRADPDRWRAEFGSDLSALGGDGDRSPKFSTPLARWALGGYAEAIGLQTRDFLAAGALARGGLSTIWGALAAEFTDQELDGFPVPAAEMRPHYAAVRERIGAPAASADALTSPAARRAFAHLSAKDRGLTVEPAPNAVLGAAQDGRQACIRCGLCLWGCHRGAIYDAALELPALRRLPHFDYRPAHRVRRLGRDGDLQVVEGEGFVLRAETVVLAAGTIASAALALPRLGLADRPAPLLTNPAAGTAFVVPGLIGADLPVESLSLGQLFYRLPLDGAAAAGVLYGADALPLHLVAERLPLSRPAALRLARALAPALIMATVYLPGRFSRNRITAGEGRVMIEGERTAEADTALRQAVGRLTRALFPAALPLPGATSLLQPGADAHYAGVLPMGAEGPFASGGFGELDTGLHAADGTVLPRLPAAHPTLTVMANAHRIGAEVARRSGGAA